VVFKLYRPWPGKIQALSLKNFYIFPLFFLHFLIRLFRDFNG